MIVECKHCGAPLDVKAGSAFARCSYCEHTSRVKSAKTLMAENPLNWAPPPVWQPPAQFSAPHVPLPYRPPSTAQPQVARPASGGCVVPVVVGVVILAVTSFALYSSGALTLAPFIGIETEGVPSAATLDLAALASAPVVSGSAEGVHDASQLGSTCRGYLPSRPQLVLRAAQGAFVRIGVSPIPLDLVMAIRTSDGQWLCDDDSAGSSMPRIIATLPAGDHRVWVGTYSQGQSAAFTFAIDGQEGVVAPGLARSAAAALAPGAPPSIGTLAAGPEPLQGSWAGTTSGWLAASGLSPSCSGSLPPAPHLAITTTEPRHIELVTSDNANVDLVMLVRSPSGRVECDDDSGGLLNPRVRTTLEPGTTSVWVGVFHEEQRGTFQLTVSETGRASEATSGLGATPMLGTVNLDLPGWPSPLRGASRAEQPARALGASCRGFVGRTHDLVILSTTTRALTITARGGQSLRLVRRDPAGRVTCAEGEGSGPFVVQQTLAPGIHHLWVGTALRRSSPFELVLAAQ